jgi:hypothetical protein
MFRGAELMRLMTGVVMLMVIVMLMTRFRDPGIWGWLAGDEQKRAEIAKNAVPQPPPLPDATGLTEEDPEQADAAREEYQAITDGALTLGPEEMESYDRLVFWVKNQSFDRLRRRARTDLLFTHFHDEPDKYRGQLVALELNVRRILDAGKNRDGVQLYEVWGFTAESRDRLYVAIVVDLPKGMPTGPTVQEKARFAGYFFKLQGYHPAGAMSGAAADKAPLLIGRLEWTPAPATPAFSAGQEPWVWGIGALALIGLLLGFRWFYHAWRRKKPAARSTIPEAAPGEVIPIEKWLEQSVFQEGAVGECSENGRTDGKTIDD